MISFIVFSLRVAILSIYLMFSVPSGVARAADNVDPSGYLKDLDVASPYCDGKIALEIAPEYFVEIANDLPGRKEYNDLIQIYRRKNWTAFDLRWQSFVTGFADSPLREAAAFLAIQVAFDRVAGEDEPAAITAEKGFREVLLAYPNSSLAPVLIASIASFWLNKGRFERSLSLYKEAQVKFPSPEFSCLYNTGIMESLFQLRDWKSSEATIATIQTSCSNPRLKEAALIRAADIHYLGNEKSAEVDYEKAYHNGPSFMEKFYPFAFLNLGEIKFRLNQISSAKYYFDEYTKFAGKEAPCAATVNKRLADIAYRTGENWQLVAGKYLGVYEHAPETDMGRYAHIRGLVMGFKNYSLAEQNRRKKIIDEDLERIQSQTLATQGYLEKGLAFLDAGNRDAVGYLVALGKKRQIDFKKGKLSNFIRERLLNSLATESEHINDAVVVSSAAEEGKTAAKQGAASPKPDVTVVDSSKFEDVLQAFDKYYGEWWKNTEFAAGARSAYEKLILGRFEEEVKLNDLNLALQTLERWTDSELWPAEGPSQMVRMRLAQSLTQLMLGSAQTGAQDVELVKHEKSLRLLTGSGYPWLWMLVAQRIGDRKKLKESLAQIHASTSRGPAAIDSQAPNGMQGELWLRTAEILVKANEYSDAESALNRIHDPKLATQVLKSRLTIFMQTKKYAKAFDVALEKFSKEPAQDQKNSLKVMYGIAWEGKLWKKADSLLDLAEKQKLAPKDEAPFRFLVGRSAYELSHCPYSIENYETGLKLDPEAENNAEARFRLGKCLLKTNRKSQAEQVWNELIKQKDPFWSPLAQNEIKLLPQ